MKEQNSPYFPEKREDTRKKEVKELFKRLKRSNSPYSLASDAVSPCASCKKLKK